MSSTFANPTESTPRGHSAAESDIGLDELFHILQNQRRRLTLEYLNSAGRAELGTVAEHVAAGEHDIDVEDVSDSQRKRTYISLYQSHVPTLAEHDVIEYDSETNVVTTGENLSQFEAYLGGSSDAVDDFSTRDGIALSTVTLALLAVAVFAFVGGIRGDVASLSILVLGLSGGLVATKSRWGSWH